MDVVNESRRELHRRIRESMNEDNLILSGYDLRGANLTYSRLIGADFRMARVRRVNFSCADLTGANFRGCNLTGATFAGSQLVGADFEGATLTGADFRSACLYRANLSRTYLASANFTAASLRCTSLFKANLTGVTGDGKVIVSMVFGWPIVMYESDLYIGCEKHTVAEWDSFSDERIDSMEVGALDWWRKNKHIVLCLARRTGN